MPESSHEYTQGSYIVVPTLSPDILGDVGMDQDFSKVMG